MTNPITPTPELIEQWMQAHSTKYDLARHAAQWGADQELEACCIELTEKIITNSFYEGDKTHSSWRELASIVVRKLRDARRPKPPSLKEQALLQLDTLNADLAMHGRGCDLSQIRRALEALND